MPLNLSKSAPAIIVCTLIHTLAACAFFEQPIDNLGTVVPEATLPDDNRTGSSLPPPLPKQAVQSAPETAAPKATPTATNASGVYLTVVTLFDLPENVPNTTFVHFSKRNARRELAVCWSLLEKFTVTPVSSIPENATGVIIWPVSNASNGDCDSMINGYEGIDLSLETAAKVSSEARGPFMLSRNKPSDKRLIFDISDVRNGGMAGAFDQWQQLTSTAPANWPQFDTAK